MNTKNKFLMCLTGLLLVFNGLFLHAGEYLFSGYLPEVVRAPGSVTVKIDAAVQRRKLYIHYRTEGLEEYQVRMMKRDKDGYLYYRLPTGNLYGKTVEYFISASDGPVPGSLSPVFTVTGFTDKGSPEIYFLGAETGANEGGGGSRFKFPVDIDPSLSTTFRVYDKSENPGESFDANGNIGLSRAISGKRSEFEFESNISYTHHVDEDESRFNLDDMGVRFKTGKHTFSAGDLSVDNSEFTASYLGRRGLRYRVEGKRLVLGSFLTNAQQRTGFGGFGVPPADAHIFGAEAGFSFGKAGRLHGMFLTGKDNLKSKTVVSADDENAYREGSVYSIRGEFKMFKEKLDLKGEFAHSTFGSGPESAGVEKKSDNAWLGQAGFRHGKVSAFANYKKIGRDFSSIGNLFLNSDREGLKSGVGLSLASFSANIKYTDERTNVNDPVMPMKITRDIETDFNWIIGDCFTVGGEFALNNLAYDKTSGEATGSDDMETIQYKATLGYAAGSNSIVFQLGKTESRHFSSDIDGSVEINLKFGKVLSVSPTFSYQSNKDLAEGTASRIYNAYINGTLTVIPEYFSMTFNLSGTRNVYTDGESTTFTANGNLNFRMAELFEKKVSPTLSLRSSYRHRKSMDGGKKSYVTFYLQLDISL